MAASHVSYIRLDAVGYGAKEAGTSCFMTPKTFKLISRLREEGVKRGSTRRMCSSNHRTASR